MEREVRLRVREMWEEKGTEKNVLKRVDSRKKVRMIAWLKMTKILLCT